MQGHAQAWMTVAILAAWGAMPPLAAQEPAPGETAHLQNIPSAPEQQEAGEPEREDKHVVSLSRMFSVSGGDALRMGAIAQRADNIRAKVNQMLHDESKWKYTVSIRLLGQNTDAPTLNPIRTRIRIIGREPNLQIRIHPGGGIDLDGLDRAIISLVLFERALREIPADSLPEQLSLPPWLATGMQQAIKWRSGTVDRRLYQNLFNRSEMLSPQEILSTENPAELDATSRQIYEVSCGVLLLSLLDRPNGPAQLRELIEEAATAEGKLTEIISAHFIELGINENLLSQWWAMELASLSIPRATDALTPMETEERLTEALTVLYYDPETHVPRPVNIDDVYTLTELPDWKKLLRSSVDKLMTLNAGCFPDYRPIIMEYCRAISELLKDTSPDEIQQILGPLREIRQGYVKSSIRGRDYLDWYEITNVNTRGRDTSYAAYRAAMDMLRHHSDGPDTMMSRYLEDIEALYERAEDAPLPKRMRDELGEIRKSRKRHEGED